MSCLSRQIKTWFIFFLKLTLFSVYHTNPLNRCGKIYVSCALCESIWCPVLDKEKLTQQCSFYSAGSPHKEDGYLGRKDVLCFSHRGGGVRHRYLAVWSLRAWDGVLNSLFILVLLNVGCYGHVCLLVSPCGHLFPFMSFSFNFFVSVFSVNSNCHPQHRSVSQ